MYPCPQSTSSTQGFSKCKLAGLIQLYHSNMVSKNKRYTVNTIWRAIKNKMLEHFEELPQHGNRSPLSCTYSVSDTRRIEISLIIK